MNESEIIELKKLADKLRDYIPNSDSDYEFIKFLLEYLLKAFKKADKEMKKERRVGNEV